MKTAHQCVLFQPSLENVKKFHGHFRVTGQPIMQPSDTKMSTGLPDFGIKLQHTWKITSIHAKRRNSRQTL